MKAKLQDNAYNAVFATYQNCGFSRISSNICKKKIFFSERTVRYTLGSRVTFSGEEGQGVGRVSRGKVNSEQAKTGKTDRNVFEWDKARQRQSGSSFTLTSQKDLALLTGQFRVS